MGALPITSDRSKLYWRSFARTVFAENLHINLIEVVKSGRKTDSEYLVRGQDTPAPGIVVILASTGGAHGKSRREFWCAKHIPPFSF